MNEDIPLLAYFWNEKGDVTRWTGYERWKAQYPQSAAILELKIATWKQARADITTFIEGL